MAPKKSIDTKNIKTITEEQHVWTRLPMYLGGSEEIDQEMVIYEKEKFVLKQQKYSQQTQKLFEEIIQNSIDNFAKHSPTAKDYYIEVTCKKRSFSVKNNGHVFALDKKDNKDVARIFSNLRSSDQYGKKQQETAGMNGLGAKLVNLCAKKFEIEVQNDGIKYTATWEDRKQKFEDETTKVDDEDSYFKTSVELLERDTHLEFSGIEATLDFCDLNIKLIEKYLIDLQLAYPNIKFSFNDKKVPKFKIEEFMKMNGIEQYVGIKKEKLNVYVFKYDNDVLFKRYSIINAIQTFSKDGKHYASLQEQLKTATKLKSQISVGMFFIGQHKGLEYSEQTKTNITTKIQLKISKDVIEFVKSLVQVKLGPRNVKNVFSKKLTEANNVTNKKSVCTLIVTEGDSAAGLFRSIKESQHDFFDNYGLFPLKGKIVNVNGDPYPGETQKKKKENEEIKNIIQIIGLKNVKYTEETIKTLRYQKILIGTDYDVDGYHICGLIINLINQYWPELLSLGFLQRFTSPIVVGYEKGKPIEFFSEQSVKAYKGKLQKVKYYKGLGSFKPEEAKHLGKNFQNYVKDIVPESDEYNIMVQKLFGDEPKDRKKLIKEYEFEEIDFSKDSVEIRELMNQVVNYSVCSLQRCIPSMQDGLKESQRKIIAYAMRNPNMTEKKVSQFASAVSDFYDYHHGEVSLQDAIIKLAQKFSGTNNCNLLTPNGQFGLRSSPESTASPRYIYTQPSQWLQILFKKEDELLYEFNKSDEGNDIEPKCLYPILPIQMVNGVNGLATGWNTYMPNYKLQDVIDYIISKLKTGEGIEINPYFNWYKGTIKMDEEKGMVNKAKFKYNKEDGSILIIDTTIKTSMADLQEYLAEKQIPHKFNEGIFIKNVPDDILTEITKKFLISNTKIQNMNFMDGPKVLEFKSVYKFFNQWIKMRLELYEKRKQAVMLQMVNQYMIHFNLKKAREEELMDLVKEGSKFDKALRYFTPMSIIEKNDDNDLDNIIKMLNEKEKHDVEMKEYNYITDKSLKFYNKYDVNQLDEIEKEYREYVERDVKDIWIQELKDILPVAEKIYETDRLEIEEKEAEAQQVPKRKSKKAKKEESE